MALTRHSLRGHADAEIVAVQCGQITNGTRDQRKNFGAKGLVKGHLNVLAVGLLGAIEAHEISIDRIKASFIWV